MTSPVSEQRMPETVTTYV